jgi:hypothetical protein
MTAYLSWLYSMMPYPVDLKLGSIPRIRIIQLTAKVVAKGKSIRIRKI